MFKWENPLFLWSFSMAKPIFFDSDILNEPHASQEDVKPCSFAPEHDIATTTPKTPQDTDENSTDGPAKSCVTRMVESQRKSWDVYPLVN